MSKYFKSKNIKDNQEGKTAYKIFIGLGIYGVTYYSFFKPLTIGHNLNYNLCILWLPIIVGLIVIYIVRRNYIRRLNRNFKTKLDRFLSYLLLFIMALMYSYLSFGISAEIIFHIVNKQKIKNEKQITYIFPIEKIDSIHSNKSIFTNKSIRFNFQNHSEKIRINESSYEELKNIDPKKLKVEIKCRKGIFEVFYIDSWIITIEE